ncbi:hypothetical protein AK812_SmicGene5167 [Symbiodinium microadriaticum]|uniref:Uncharacterized protein n=1 Tax=Symbiodinium microadriaticum TaxID=2951 RepID=A0A1Q9EUH3_SYMMI|nr:hypothetical protein AK812_SmicGene5167 [Symbiodinium microadriaticum]
MGKSVSVVVPKKGKKRMVQKRPAARKTKLWKQITYVRDKLALPSRGQRKDQIKWKRTLPELLKATGTDIIRILRADKLLIKWEGKRCPFCCKGFLSKLQPYYDGSLKHRCSYRNCHKRMNPHHLHPLFTEGTGSSQKSLQEQAAMLLLKLHNVKQSSIHMLLGVNHKAVEDVERKLCRLRKEYVEAKEKEIVFGDGKGWQDVEADEATFDKRDISRSINFKHLLKDKNCPVLWEQWAGIIQRGRPHTLVLRKLTPKLTVKRAPGPGAVRRIEWKGIAEQLLANRKVVLHTDSAKSYRLKLPGVLHDRVIHCKKRVKVKGKMQWGFGPTVFCTLFVAYSLGYGAVVSVMPMLTRKSAPEGALCSGLMQAFVASLSAGAILGIAAAAAAAASNSAALGPIAAFLSLILGMATFPPLGGLPLKVARCILKAGLRLGPAELLAWEQKQPANRLLSSPAPSKVEVGKMRLRQFMSWSRHGEVGGGGGSSGGERDRTGNGCCEQKGGTALGPQMQDPSYEISHQSQSS